MAHKWNSKRFALLVFAAAALIGASWDWIVQGTAAPLAADAQARRARILTQEPSSSIAPAQQRSKQAHMGEALGNDSRERVAPRDEGLGSWAGSAFSALKEMVGVDEEVDDVAPWPLKPKYLYTEEERAAIGLTPVGLHGSRQGAGWMGLSLRLRGAGHAALADAAERVAGLAWETGRTTSQTDPAALLREEAELLQQMRHAEGLSEGLRSAVAELDTGHARMQTGQLASVEDKIAGESEEEIRIEHGIEQAPREAEERDIPGNPERAPVSDSPNGGAGSGE